jgi:glycosyltransferase involved in cell wall biosynthesis
MAYGQTPVTVASPDSHRRLRLLYVTYGENILQLGVLQGQVVKMLVNLRRSPEIDHIRLVSFVSARLWWRKKDEFQAFKEEMRGLGIDFKLAWLFAALKWSWVSIPIMTLTNLPLVIWYAASSRADIIHARSYGAGWLSALAGKVLPCPVLFDPRDPYPDVMAHHSRWKVNGVTHRVWKCVERSILHSTAGAIGVTPDHTEELKRIGGRQCHFVPNRADTKQFSVPYRYDEEKPTLLFTGVMDLAYYGPDVIAGHFLRMKQYIPALSLKIVTLSDTERIREGLIIAGVVASDFTIETASPQDMPEKMTGSALGLHIAIRFQGPVKFAEYLSAGIPLVVVKGIDFYDDLVTREKLGVVVDPGNPLSYAGITDILSEHAAYSQRCREYAQQHLDISQTAREYVTIYQQILAG